MFYKHLFSFNTRTPAVCTTYKNLFSSNTRNRALHTTYMTVSHVEELMTW